jgi:hypothetical protein
MDRRGFMKAILAAGVAPYVVTTSGVLMPVRRVITLSDPLPDDWTAVLDEGAPYVEWLAQTDEWLAQTVSFTFNLGPPIRGVASTLLLELEAAKRGKTVRELVDSLPLRNNVPSTRRREP